jgi:bacterioferritin-associated ferredoxin
MEPTAVENDEIICKCHQVSESTIRSCIEAKNLTTVEQVTKACDAGGGCHSCHILIDLFIDEHQRKTTPIEIQADAPKAKKRGILGRFFNKIKPDASALK